MVAIAIAPGLARGSGRAAAGAWSTPDYVAAGVPDPAHPWSAAEVERAVKAILLAAQGHPERLPRDRSASSGAVFARLVEQQQEDPSAVAGVRVSAHLVRYRALADAANQYGDIDHMPPPHEWIELYGAVLHEGAALEKLSSTFLVARPGDRGPPDRRAVVDKLRESTGKVLLVHLIMAVDPRIPAPDRVAALGHLADTAPTMLPVIRSQLRDMFRRHLVKLVGASRGDVHDAAVRLQRMIDTA